MKLCRSKLSPTEAFLLQASNTIQTEFQVSSEYLDHFAPSNASLLQLVFRRVDESMLQEIAEADCNDFLNTAG
jgi:hypothetical protein